MKAPLLLGILSFLAVGLVWAQGTPASKPAGSAADLNAIADQVFTLFAGATTAEHDDQQSKAPPGQTVIMRRPVFSKAHGCLQGRFVPDPALPKELQAGVFSGPAYPAWVRFSNDGAVGPDTVPVAQGGNPARGMAIKLVGVPGPKLLPGQESALTQDFLMENHPAFFSATAADFLAFNQDFNGFMASHPAENKVLTEIGAAQLSDPLEGQYWTPTPYSLGSTHSMKYMAKPCVLQSTWNQMTGDNYLHDNLNSHVLAATGPSDLCMDFYIQLYKDPVNTPLDNAVVAWNEGVSPMIHAARLTFAPKQDINATARVARCESLSFNGWHAIPEHTPLGSLNALREIVYQKIAAMRLSYNNANGHPMPVTEPTAVTDSP